MVFSPEEMAAYNTKAAMYREEGRYNEARDLLHHGLRSARVGLGEDSEITLSMMHNYGSLLIELKKFDEAVPLFEECLAGRRLTLGAAHADTCATMANYAVLLHSQSKFEEELALRKEQVAALQKKGKTEKVALDAVDELVLLYVELGMLVQAVPLMTESLEHYLATYGRGCKSYVSPRGLNAASTLYSKLQDSKDSLGNTIDAATMKRLVTALVGIMSERKPGSAPDAAVEAPTATAPRSTEGMASAALRPEVHDIISRPEVAAAIKTLRADPSQYERLMAENPSLQEAFQQLTVAASSEKAGGAEGGTGVDGAAAAPTPPIAPAPPPAASSSSIGGSGSPSATGGAAAGGAPSSIDELLKSLGLSKYAPTFEEEEMDLEVMRDVLLRQGRAAMDEVLKELGVSVMGHRTRIINGIEAAA